MTAGLQVHAGRPAAPAGAGVLLFERVAEELFQQVQELSGHGRERLLAVACEESLVGPSVVWELLDAGASDVVVLRNTAQAIEQIRARIERWQAVDELLPVVEEKLIGGSLCWRRLVRQVVEVARFTDAPVLLLGESGTGKELLARLVHELDRRTVKRELVTVDCTTIVPELSGSELFGHERGAFTGAMQARDGAFALANGGTLFLDEVGELATGLQAQLLRAVQEKTYKRVGGNSWQHTSFRLVSATNRDLVEATGRGEFRRDLYYRLATWTFRPPPLRERREDILPLARHFLSNLFGNEPEFETAVADYLMTRDYPGNVRELRQLVTRLGYRHVGPGPISAGDIPPEDRPLAGSHTTVWPDAQFEASISEALNRGTGLKQISQAAADTAIRITVQREEGNLQKAARRLGVTDRALQLRKANSRSK